MGLSKLIHGEKPKVAPFKPTDPNEMLRRLLNGEITDWPEIQQLSELFQNQQFEQMGFDLPSLLSLGGEDAQKTLEQASTMLGGNIPEDVLAKVRRDSAFQNITAGTYAGAMGGANAVRNLGLTSLDMIKQGADLATSGGNAAQRWAAIAQGTMLPQSAYLYSPQWYTDFMAKQAAAKRDAQQQKFNVAAQPDPAWAQRGKLAGSILATYAGGGMGGGSGNAMDYQGSVPTGGLSGAWAQATGQPYDMLGSNSGASTSIQQNVTPFLTNPDGSLFYQSPPNQFPNQFNSMPPVAAPVVQTNSSGGTIPPWIGY